VSSSPLAAARRCVTDAVIDPAAEPHRATILRFIDEHPDALLRSCAEGHLTGSGMVIDPASERFLLMLHAKLGLWLQPGGHADGEGDLTEVALAECREETGIDDLDIDTPAIDLDVHRVDPPGEPPHLHLDARYLVVAPPHAVARGNVESLDLRWVSLDELTDLGVDHGTTRLARAALAAFRSRSGAH
jgi:8-oxo-dGTP pyrophosphatase MutT (NUDIX family)